MVKGQGFIVFSCPFCLGGDEILNVKEMITHIRHAIHDEQMTGFADEELLSYINDGVKFLRRTIMDIYPFFLADVKVEGELEKGMSDIDLGEKVTKLLDVHVNGRQIQAINPMDIKDRAEEGTPRAFYRIGLTKVRLFPTPKSVIPYSITAISDQKLLDVKDDTPFSNDFDDFVYEYAVLRAAVTDEFSMQQEQAIMANIVQQVEALLYSYGPVGIDLTGYWDGG